MTLTDFLLARIAYDERVYRGTQHGLRPQFADRLIAECEAKRAVVAYCEGLAEEARDEGPAMLRHLATIYADHPDYRQEWRP